ncbi:Uncharacterized protein APZ42_031403 [Daphnia magna]|uniref:Uncharacterized protein n=1 Tax=Daphnia magna TaxID=35525 RepID=A0A164MUU4_9CRUS|nr:Uncharacterized protein APZ42_031403 [Daphnia magna]
MAENFLSLPENSIGLALLDCLESGLDDLFEKTISDCHASEIVELVAVGVGYNENGSVLFKIDTNEELKEDSSKNLAVNDFDISIVAETIPKRSHESVCDKNKDFPVEYSSEPSCKKQKPTKPILKPKETTGYFFKKQVPTISNEVVESGQFRKPTTLTVSVPPPHMEILKALERQTDSMNTSEQSVHIITGLMKPTVVDVPSDNLSTSLPSRKADEKKKDNKRSTFSSAYKPPFAEK